MTLPRRVPLVRKPMTRTAPMPRAATPAPRSRLRDTGPTPEVRQAVYAREGYACALCSSRDGAFAVHHRRPRGMGGTSRPSANLPGSLLLLCEPCHVGLESDRTDALDNGWLVGQHVEDPSACPVVYRGRTVLLGNDGSVTECPTW